MRVIYTTDNKNLTRKIKINTCNFFKRFEQFSVICDELKKDLSQWDRKRKVKEVKVTKKSPF